MNVLTIWISQMIILVFIMIITRMLLPEKKMKKYAQFSLALIFLYFFIQPIRHMYNVNIGRESYQLIDSIVGELPSDDLTGSVEIKKSEIEATSDAYVIEELANQLIHEIEDDFAQAFDYHLEDVIIITENDRQLDFDQLIFRLIVSENTGQISEIQPIIINTSESEHGKDTKTREVDHELLSWFSDRLDIDLGRVQIVWEEG